VAGARQTVVQPITTGVEPPRDNLQSLVRLLVGSALVGTEMMADRIQQHERQAEAHPAIGQGPEQSSDGALLRYVIIGLIFDSMDQAKVRLPQLRRLTYDAAGWVSWGASPIMNFPLFRPFRTKLQSMGGSLTGELARWAALGHRQEMVSRALTVYSVDELVDQVLAYLAAKPEVRSLIQQQGYSLAEEVIENVRERTATADNFVEQLVRGILQRTPRSELPDAPPTVRSQAVHAPRFRQRPAIRP
jgi:hypothetical protein